MVKIENFKIQLGILFSIEILTVIALMLLKSYSIALVIFFAMILNAILIIWVIYRYEKSKYQRDVEIINIVGTEASEALEFGEIGIVTYDDNYDITWCNDFIAERNDDIIGKKTGSWIPEINRFFKEDIDRIVAVKDDYVYEVSKKDNKNVLYIKDITKYSNLENKYKDESLVVGLLHLDNYMDLSQYEDEAKMSLIDANLRQALVDWARSYGMLVRRLRSDRYLVILNEAIFNELTFNQFDIVKEIGKAAHGIDVAITLSMAFVMGSEDIKVLDSAVNDVLELALSRGGDQVAYKRIGEDVTFFGGNSEAPEKRSKVRVRVMANAIKEAINDSKNIYIVGHKLMDFDCMGAALFVSKFAKGLNKKAYIVSESAGLEEQLSTTFEAHREELEKDHIFISESEALKRHTDKDLIICVDHHSLNNCGCSELVKTASKVVIIDHHRRSTGFFDNPILVYIESVASSVCELVIEFMPYINNDIELSEFEATLIYAGIIIDTNRFKTRTGSRTFEACSKLKQLGVDPIKAEELFKENFENIKSRSLLTSNAQKYHSNIIISTYDETCVSRTLISSVADSFLEIKGIEASFVIAKEAKDLVTISARSRGLFNVQRVIESLGGGGHFTMAGLQTSELNVEQVKELLLEKIEEYLKEDISNESNIIS